MRKKEKYSSKFYENRSASLKSAEIIVPEIMNLIKPKSVIDFGCGNGSFLSIFKKNGVKDMLGIDGPWIEKRQLLISEKEFKERDLENFVSIDKKFDLAVCLEVAEHLPKKVAGQFIRNITKQSDMVLFSAAIPLQGGVNHINEQWQTYWIDIFKKNGYLPLDYFREKLWNNENVSFWFAQNMFLFIKEESLKNNKKLRLEFENMGKIPKNIVHPKLFYPKAKRYNQITSIIPVRIKKILNSIKFLK